MNYRIVWSVGQVLKATSNFKLFNFKVLNLMMLQIPELTTVNMHAIRSRYTINGFSLSHKQNPLNITTFLLKSGMFLSILYVLFLCIIMCLTYQNVYGRSRSDVYKQSYTNVLHTSYLIVSDSLNIRCRPYPDICHKSFHIGIHHRSVNL